MNVDIVVGDQLLDRPAPGIGLRLVVGDEELDWSSKNSALLVDAVDCDLHPNERGLAARGGDPGQRLLGAEAVGLGRAKGAPPRRRREHRGAEPNCGARRGRPEHSAAGQLDAAKFLASILVTHCEPSPVSLDPTEAPARQAQPSTAEECYIAPSVNDMED